MKIHKIKITNFKSIYGTQEFDFDDITGMVKLSGPIGSGKTTIGEAIIFGLYGTIKDHKNPNLIAWNTKDYNIEIWLTSGKHDIYISRQCYSEMIAKVDGKDLIAPSKNDYQRILEQYYDVPKIAVDKMCIISFTQFTSLAQMNPFQTKCFLDDVFGFKTFTEFNDEVVEERRDTLKRGTEINALIREVTNQIQTLEEKKLNQQKKLADSIDIDGLTEIREEYINEGKLKKQEQQNKTNSIIEERNPLEHLLSEYKDKRTEAGVKGKQVKKIYETLKLGECPTCGHKIGQSSLDRYVNELKQYADEWHNWDDKVSEVTKDISTKTQQINLINNEYNALISDIKRNIHEIDTKIATYKSNLMLMQDNFDNLIEEAKAKKLKLEQESLVNDKEQGEWNDLSELFTKSLRYKLLDTMIPHINNCISIFLNKLEQNYCVKFDQEFKCHIFIDNNEKEISYKDLSTGQKKTLDICIIFGILQNIIANCNFNILFLDELFSNMDSDMRGMMLDMIKNGIAKDKTIFVINHSDMPDTVFDHKIKVGLTNKKITKENIKKSLCGGNVIVYSSKYEKIF